MTWCPHFCIPCEDERFHQAEGEEPIVPHWSHATVAEARCELPYNFPCFDHSQERVEALAGNREAGAVGGEMTAGRELDAEIAEKVMGHGLKRPAFGFDGRIMGYVDDLPAYSTDIAVAWQVVEHMRERGLSMQVTLEEDGTVECRVLQDIGLRTHIRGVILVEAHVPNPAPLAICLAALKAVGIETEAQDGLNLDRMDR